MSGLICRLFFWAFVYTFWADPHLQIEVGLMPPVPPDQVSPYGAPQAVTQDGLPAHLTMDELAQRWRRTRKTIERHYQRWGLVPLRFGGRLLFPIQQVLEAEERAMRGEFVRPIE